MLVVSFRWIRSKIRIWWGGRLICLAGFENPKDDFYRVLNWNMPCEGSISSFWLIFRVFRAPIDIFWSLNLISSYAQNRHFLATSGPNVYIVWCCSCRCFLDADFIWSHCLMSANITLYMAKSDNVSADGLHCKATLEFPFLCSKSWGTHPQMRSEAWEDMFPCNVG